MYGDIETKGVSHNLPNDDAVPLDDRRSNCLWRLASRYAEGLPATSGSIFQLNDLLCRNVLDLAAVVRVLSSDLSLAAQVIRRANEGIPEDEEKQYRLEDCAVLLGGSRLRCLVLTTALSPTDHETSMRLQALLQHCELTSRFGERIAAACGHPEPQKAQIAGLVHDLGELPVYLERRHVEKEHGSGDVDHCFVGSWLAKVWNFPPFLTDVIEHHHDPGRARRDPFLVTVTAAADEASRAFGVGMNVEPGVPVNASCTAALDRYLTFLNHQQRLALADALHSEFLVWVRSPRDVEVGDGAAEGKIGTWQFAL